MIRWTCLAPWEIGFPFPGCLTSIFLYTGASRAEEHLLLDFRHVPDVARRGHARLLRAPPLGYPGIAFFFTLNVRKTLFMALKVTMHAGVPRS